MRRQHWIPPVALGAGQLAHAGSWIVLFLLAGAPQPAFGLRALAWVHLVALGWLTLTALAVLVHVIPAFTDAAWWGNGLARAALFAFAGSVLWLVLAFWNGAVMLLPWAGLAVLLALGAYLVPALVTLARAWRAERTEAAIARALTGTLGALVVTAVLGSLLTFALAGRLSPSLLNGTPIVHATFGTIGWLSVLIFGVSARTIGPIAGRRTRYPQLHVSAGALELAGIVLLTAGVWAGAGALTLTGVVAIVGGALVYACDMLLVLAGATVRHRPPQAFLAAGIAWLLVALALAAGTFAGNAWGPAAVYVLLIGWAGQLVNAHIHHIGIRLLATIVRGDDDETRPGVLLAAPLSWTAFALFQSAVLAGGIALGAGLPALLAAAAVAGFAGWLCVAGNVVTAVRRARRPDPPPPLGATISLLG